MCPPNILSCVHVSVLLARILTTPFRVFHTQHTRSSLIKTASGMWGVYCRARLGVIFFKGSYYAVLTFFSFRDSVQYPSTSVSISWHGRQLITVLYHLSFSIPSKKQISGIGTTSLIGGASSSNCLSV